MSVPCSVCGGYDDSNQGTFDEPIRSGVCDNCAITRWDEARNFLGYGDRR